MTGAGSLELLFSHESGFAQSPQDTDSSGSPDYYGFGRDPSIDEIGLNRQLERLREPLSVESAESIAKNAEGSFDVSAVVSSDTFKEVEKVVFNDGPGDGFAPGRPSSMRVYTDLDYLDGTVARELVGVIPVTFDISYTQGEMVEFSMSCFYATENTDTSVDVTPSDITRVSDGTSVPFHGFDLSIDAGSVSKLQDATLSFEGISDPHYGADPIATDAEVQGVEPTLDVTAIITGRSKYELGLGSSGATTVQDSVDSVPGTITITAPDGSTLSEYSLPQLTIQGTPSWEDAFNSDESTTENYTMNVDGGVSVS